MTPFCVQKLIMLMQDFGYVDNNIVEVKINFCNDCERELKYNGTECSENIFDLIYNMYAQKRAISQQVFKKLIEELMDIDYSNTVDINKSLDSIYKSIILSNRDYFFRLFRFEKEEQDYIETKFCSKYHENMNKLLEHYK